MAEISRLSPYNINDDLLRVQLYREIRDAQNEFLQDGWTEYTVQPADILRPELISYKQYQTASLKWLILVAAGLDDMREALQDGAVLKLPTTTWVRLRIKYYMDLESSARK